MKFTANDLRVLRHSRKMQQKDVAIVMKITVQRYSVLENNENRPNDRTIEILKALNFTIKTARRFLDSIP